MYKYMIQINKFIFRFLVSKSYEINWISKELTNSCLFLNFDLHVQQCTKFNSYRKKESFLCFSWMTEMSEERSVGRVFPSSWEALSGRIDGKNYIFTILMLIFCYFVFVFLMESPKQLLLWFSSHFAENMWMYDVPFCVLVVLTILWSNLPL